MRVVHIEENWPDAEMVRAALTAEGFECDWVQVSTKADFVYALKTGRIDLILAEYLHTEFDGISALALARRSCPSVPFIFVTASLDEAVAIETMKSGASDYVSKYRLSKLAPAVRRAFTRLYGEPAE